MTKRPNQISDMDWLEYQGQLTLLIVSAIGVHILGGWSFVAIFGIWFAWMSVSVILRARRDALLK